MKTSDKCSLTKVKMKSRSEEEEKMKSRSEEKEKKKRKTEDEEKKNCKKDPNVLFIKRQPSSPALALRPPSPYN